MSNDTAADTDAWLGTLPVDADEQRPLPAPFQALAAYVEDVVSQYEAGTYTPDAAAGALATAMLPDGAGGHWTQGAQTRRWYHRHSDSPWVATEPPRA